MSTHDVGHYQHTTRKRYRQGCIMDWLESVAGWGKQVRTICPCTACQADGVELHTSETWDWYQIAMDWQHNQIGKHGSLISCVVAGCDGVQ